MHLNFPYLQTLPLNIYIYIYKYRYRYRYIDLYRYIPYSTKAPCRHLRRNQLMLKVCKRPRKISLIKPSRIRSRETQNFLPKRALEVFPGMLPKTHPQASSAPRRVSALVRCTIARVHRPQWQGNEICASLCYLWPRKGSGWPGGPARWTLDRKDEWDIGTCGGGKLDILPEEAETPRSSWEPVRLNHIINKVNSGEDSFGKSPKQKRAQT
jgi:hypothetical protein